VGYKQRAVPMPTAYILESPLSIRICAIPFVSLAIREKGLGDG